MGARKRCRPRAQKRRRRDVTRRNSPLCLQSCTPVVPTPPPPSERLDWNFIIGMAMLVIGILQLIVEIIQLIV